MSSIRDQLGSLSATVSQMAALDDREEILQLAAQSAKRLTGASYTSIGLVEGDVIHWRSAAGKPVEEVRGIRMPISEGLCGWVVRKGRSRRSGDLTKEPDYFQQYAEMRSEMDVPILLGREVAGVLSNESPRLEAFTEDHLALAELLASCLALALSFDLRER